MTKEQILVFFSNLHLDGLILDYTFGGEISVDIEEGGCMDMSDMQIPKPDDEKDWYGLWLWEGKVSYDDTADTVEYFGGWRRPSTDEINLLSNGYPIVVDLEEEKQDNLMIN